jgi:penicillin V acylase-like amidase (Ntn superfamily)
MKTLNILAIYTLTLVVSLHSLPAFACTIFHVTDQNDQVLVGRNFDWETAGGRVWFIPATDTSNGLSIFEQDGVDMPYEGINDKGLFIAIAAVPDTNTPLSIVKPIRKSLELVKIVLEQAQTVAEALQIFPQYTVVFGSFLGNPHVHYKIVDKNGKSAIVEYVANEMKITRDINSQVMTNHYVIAPKLGTAGENSVARYNTARNNLKSLYSVKDVQNLLATVSQRHTLWSNVYDLDNQVFYVKYQDSKTVVFDLKNELYRGKHGYSLANLNKVLEYPPTKTNVIVRPHFGYGMLDDEGIYHYGGRILLPASDKRYGLEFTQFVDDNDESFSSIGIVLEQRLFNWFNMSIGTIGYFDYGVDSDNVIGLTTNLGWEPDNHIPLKPFITYRNDVIFGDDTDTIHSLSIGFSLDF